TVRALRPCSAPVEATFEVQWGALWSTNSRFSKNWSSSEKYRPSFSMSPPGAADSPIEFSRTPLPPRVTATCLSLASRPTRARWAAKRSAASSQSCRVMTVICELSPTTTPPCAAQHTLQVPRVVASGRGRGGGQLLRHHWRAGGRLADRGRRRSGGFFGHLDLVVDGGNDNAIVGRAVIEPGRYAARWGDAPPLYLARGD